MPKSTKANARLFETDSTPEETPKRQHRGVNSLNDLDTREWLKSTKSVWYSDPSDLEPLPHLDEVTQFLRREYGDKEAESILGQLTNSIMVSRPGPRDPDKAEHPATFGEKDIQKLIEFFTKSGDTVLDPFLGSGSTLIACSNANRNGVGIEVSPKWHKLANQRLKNLPSLPFEPTNLKLDVKKGDARSVLKKMDDEGFSFIVTSPPYWSMLNKPADHKVKQERVAKGRATRYSKSTKDIANLESYETFLKALTDVFQECVRVLKKGRYIAVVVSDFRDKDRFYLFHADIARLLEEVGFRMSGITILAQDSKTLYPYGMPYAFVSNIHHQYIVIARRL